MPAPRILALVLLVILSGVMADGLQAAPVPFQPYGEKSSAEVVLQLATINHAPWRVELDNILAQQSSDITSAELSGFEELIVQYQDDKQALLLLVPLYWLVTEHSGHIEQRQHFLAQFISASDDFMRLVTVGLLLQIHELSFLNVNDNDPFRQDIRFQYEQLLTQFQQQEPPYLLSLWASALLHFYRPGGGLSEADNWLQSQAESIDSTEVIIVYRKIFHDLAGRPFPSLTPNCWPLTCASAMTTDEMARRAQRAYKVFSNDGFGQAWNYLQAGVHCLYGAQFNPQMFRFSLCLSYFSNLNTMLRMLEDSLAVNGFSAGWQEYRLLKESYAETLNFQSRVSRQVEYSYRNEERRIDQIEDPEARLEASQNLLNGALAGFASAASVQQQRQRNARQLQAIRDAKAKNAAIEQAFSRFEADYKSLLQQINHSPDNEGLREELLKLTDSQDARTGLTESGRDKLRKEARSNLASVRESNRITRLCQQYKERKAAILQRFEQNPEAALEDLIGLVNSEMGECLTSDSRNTLREKYQTELTTLRAEQRARAEEQARIQSSFERVSRQAKNLLGQIKQSPDNEELLNEYLALLDSPDAKTGLADSYRQKARAHASELLDIARKNQRNQRLFREYQDEYTAIMATYEEDPIVANEKALALLNTEKVESLTPESRQEQRELHQSRLDRLRTQEQAQKERAEFEVLPKPFGDEEVLFFSALEAIGRGEDPVSQGIERTTENLVRISYEHFPKGTELVLDALSHIDNTINTVVEFIDDSTGNTATAIWQPLDETTQARILGAGKVLSVLVPVGKVKALAELARTPSPALKKDGWHPESVEARHKEWQENYGGREEHDYQGVSGYVPPPATLKAFPEAYRVKEKTYVQGGGGKRYRWKDKKGLIYEWDYENGAIEKYDKRGNHLGEFDSISGEQVKPADRTRTVEP